MLLKNLQKLLDGLELITIANKFVDGNGERKLRKLNQDHAST